jgi:hypothetical protein
MTYQPYPAGATMPEVQRPPVPAQVANAVKAMYAGAVASVAGIVIEIATVGATKAAIERRSRNLTVSQVNASQHALIAGFIAGGVIAAVIWIVLARACRDGKKPARTIGTVLVALATVDAVIGVVSPVATADRLWGLVVWLIGLTAVILLWQRPSTEFFAAASR